MADSEETDQPWWESPYIAKPLAVEESVEDESADDQNPVIEGKQVYMPLGEDGKPVNAQQIQCFVPYIHVPHIIEVGEFNFVKYIYECRGRIYIDGD